jgi:phosphinothricin acetyltransferase
MCTIRPANISDLSAITEIYNEAIRTTTATFDTEPKTEDEQKVWFDSHGPKYPILVAESSGVVVGWASLSKWSDRWAYSGTAEFSLYVKGEFRGKGFGRKLMEAIVSEGKRAGFHTVIGRIAEGNEVSIRLAESVGFRHMGVMKEVGRKFGKLLDVYLVQKIYPRHERITSPNTE